VPAEVLSRRALNRALLARQHLLAPVAGPVADAVEHLVGMQAQVPADPYIALRARLVGFDPAELSALVMRREMVRMPLLRTTLHLVTARDAASIRPLVQPVLERGFWTGSPFGRRLGRIDVAPILASGRELLENDALTTAELGRRLAERWPAMDPVVLAYTVRYLEPVVQVPPRGEWRRSGAPRWTTLDAAIGAPAARSPHHRGLDRLVERYLAAFGPGSVADAQTWSWLTRLREVFERLRPSLRAFRDEAGHELFDLPDAPRPADDTPAPVRFLPQYDNVTLSHADRSRIVADGDRHRLYERLNLGVATFTVDGFVAGQWRVRRERGRPMMRVVPLARLAGRDAAAVQAEAARVVEFVHDEPGDVQLLEPGADITGGDRLAAEAVS
jgi:hypothetical protein